MPPMTLTYLAGVTLIAIGLTIMVLSLCVVIFP